MKKLTASLALAVLVFAGTTASASAQSGYGGRGGRTANDGGSGGSSRSSGQVLGVTTSTTPSPTPSPTPTSCSPLLTSHIGIGKMNNGVEVMKLQKFLNSQGIPVALTGPGSVGNETTFYGPRTMAAVKVFQAKYASEILTPQGLTSPTGYVGTYTLAKINALYCSPQS